MKKSLRCLILPITLTCLLLHPPTPACTQTFPVDTILYNGNPSKFINLVFLGDGFQPTEMAAFTSNVQNFTGYLFQIPPFKEYANYFNLFTVNVPSVESGASHPGTATDVTEPAFPVASVNNYFGSRFDVSSIHRLLVPNNFSGINSVLANNFPQFDQKLILVNSPHYGGSGGSTATASLNGSSFEIMVHEMGHSFAGLADEYYAGDGFAGERVNMTKESNPALVKWKNWLGEDGVGIYMHCCGGNSDQWYRPHQGCKMRYLGAAYPFCPVCRETIFERIHELFGTPVLSFLPASSSVVSCAEPIVFKLNMVKPDPNTLKVTWNLNGTTLPNTSDSLVVDFSLAAPGINNLSAIILDTTAFTRQEAHFQNHQSSVHWTFQFDPVSIPVIVAGGPLALCPGDSVTLSASPAASYSWSNGASTQNIVAYSAGNYAVTVSSSNGCTAESAATAVLVHPPLALPAIMATDSSLVSSIGMGNQWYLDGAIIPGADASTYFPTATGFYTVVVTDMNGCSAVSAPFFFMVSSSYDLNPENELIIVPNPNDGRFQVRFAELPCAEVKIFNETGKLVFQGAGDAFIDLRHLTSGTFVLECNGGGKLTRKKMVIQR